MPADHTDGTFGLFQECFVGHSNDVASLEMIPLVDMPNWHLTNQQHSFPHEQKCEEESEPKPVPSRQLVCLKEC